ncbi:MAG: bifunctional 3,4-dihydroxy-2-butanone-4-phosphate synthase/GTP cyclohydrolase II [Solirubrobacterales bacterium]
MKAPFTPIGEAIAAIGRGEIVVVVDDEARENEGDLVMAAEFATPAALAFFVRHTAGVICAPITPERCEELRLPPMVEDNTESHGTAFTASVDAVEGTSTGISAADRAATLRALADPAAGPADFARPGHVFPLRARPGGVLKRAGHTEAAVDLARLAGCRPAGVICEIVNPDGSMARLPELIPFAAEHGLMIVSIADLVRHRHRTERLVRRVATAELPTEWATFSCHVYEDLLGGADSVALVLGDVGREPATLVRVHSECLTGDIFGSRRCDCGAQLHDALAKIAAAGSGVVVYLRGHEGRGIGLAHKIRAYSLQDGVGLDTLDANLVQGLPVDDRDYGIGAQILTDLGVRRLRLMTNNPAKYSGLEGYDLDIVERVPMPTVPTPENRRYLQTKVDRMGHLFDADVAARAESTATEPKGEGL